MKMKALLIAGALLAVTGLGGCSLFASGAGPNDTPAASGDPLGGFVSFTKADLEAAEANAIATNNTVMIPCPPALEKWLDSTVGQAGQLQVKGLFSGAVAGEAVVNNVQAGVPDYVYSACGPAYMKFHAQIYKLIGKAAILGG